MTLRAACRALSLTAALAVPGLTMAGVARANDSSGFQGTTGLELAHTDAIRMASEDLHIGLKQITVSYVFENVTDQPVETMVVFPLPDLDLSLGLTAPNWAFPVEGDDFLNFRLWVDDRPLAPGLERRAFYHGQDVTPTVEAAGAMGLVPWKMGGYDEQVKSLPAKGIAELKKAGLIQEGEDENTPQWVLRGRYFWQQSFPPHAQLRIRHSYQPFVGQALIGKANEIDGHGPVGRLIGAAPVGEDRYCLDEATRRALAAVERRTPKDAMAFTAAELDYILTTARNWRGPIGRFHLTLDKGAPDNIMSLCWNGLAKTSPTTFEATIFDFVPDHDIRLLVFVRSQPQ